MALDPTPIRWCVCGNTLFAELKEAGVTSLEEAQERFGVAIHCESCIPYIERMLRTGETAFPVRLKEDPPKETM